MAEEKQSVQHSVTMAEEKKPVEPAGADSGVTADTTDSGLTTSPNNAPGTTNAVSEETFTPDARFWLCMAPLAVLALMVALDGTSVSVTPPTITEGLHGTAIEAFWTRTSFLFSSTVFQLPMGAFSDIFGHRPVLLFCITFFLAEIIISSVANNFTVMLIRRTIQGVGGGGVILLYNIVITDLVPMRERGKYFGVIGVVWGIGSVSGPVIGGAVTLKATWRWIFWINISFAVIAIFMVIFYMRLKKPTTHILEKLRQVDCWLGSVWFVAAATCFVIPLTWGGVIYSWSSWQTLFPFLLGIAALGAFAVYEARVPDHSIFKVELIRDYNLCYSLVGTVINASVVFGTLYFAPLYFEAALGYSPVMAGVALFPATFTIGPVSAISGVIISKTGDFRRVVQIGSLMSTLGLGVCMALRPGLHPLAWFFEELTLGIGLGLLYTSLEIVNLAGAANDRLMAAALSLYIFSRMLGQTLGVAISGVVFQNQMRASLRGTSWDASANEVARDATGIAYLVSSMPDGASKTELQQAYCDALRIVFGVFCAMSGTATIGSFFLRHVSLDRTHETKHGIVRAAGAETEVAETEVTP